MPKTRRLGLAELSRLLRERKISAPELVRIFLCAIEERDGEIHSYLTVCKERAEKQAVAAQRLLDRGEGGPLTGLPLAVKDNICIKGVETTCASRMLAGFMPPYTATAVERLEAAGMVVLGKTNMDEFAMGNASATSAFGGPRNPLELTRSPGGSSGGSAAAVAAGLAPAALGSDTGGSVRQPAAFCGLWGLKPTYGAVSRYGLIAFASSMDQIGPIARSATDCGLLFWAMAGKDRRDMTSVDLPLEGRAAPDHAVIGLPEELFSQEIAETVRVCAHKAAKTFEKMGCRLRTVSLPSLRAALPAYYLLSSAEAASNLARYDGVRYGVRQAGDSFAQMAGGTRRAGFGREVKRRILLGNYALSAGYYDAYYQRAQAVRERLRRELDELLTQCDFLLSPTVPTTAFRLEGPAPSPADMYGADLCTVPANLAGLPALNLPAGPAADGMPAGVTLMGRAFADRTLLAMGRLWEERRTDG